MKNTILLYLDNAYLFESTGIILETGENEMGTYIILDRTICYPQGGGQPSDRGMIESNGAVFRVEKVRIDEAGIVYHYGRFEGKQLMSGEFVQVSIDGEYRLANTQCHSAGHLINVAMREIGLESLTPTKGYHFSDGPYVEYSGKLSDSPESLISRLQEALDDLIRRDMPVIISYDAQSASPVGKTPRYVSFGGYTGCGCGGTHVRSSSEIGSITIRKIKMKDGNLRVSYSVG